MASMVASRVVDRGFEADRIKPKTKQIVFVASPQSTHR